MNSYIISLLLLACAEGFAPHAQSTTGNLRVASSYCRNKPIIIFASEDSNESDDSTLELDSDDDYDFERGFQERLMKEGGETGVKVKAAKRSVDGQQNR